MKRPLACVAFCLAALCTAPLALAHAFPTHSSPAVGATVAASPQQVKIWFDGDLEPVFSKLTVTNAAGKQVSTGNGTVDAKNAKLLEAGFPSALPAGKYKVTWSVIAHDGHHTEGHFNFSVK